MVLLSAATWQELTCLRDGADADAPIFRSLKSGHLDPAQILLIVRAAARQAGIRARASPHWLRHAYASHALDRGCPNHLVQATLGQASVATTGRYHGALPRGATTGRYLHARPTDSSARYLAPCSCCLRPMVRAHGANQQRASWGEQYGYPGRVRFPLLAQGVSCRLIAYVDATRAERRHRRE